MNVEGASKMNAKVSDPSCSDRIGWDRIPYQRKENDDDEGKTFKEGKQPMKN